MTEKCQATNCQQHIQVFAWTCAFFIVFMTILIGYVIANENRRVDSDKALATVLTIDKEKQADRFWEVTTRIDSGFLEVKQRLARIEAKIEK